MGSPLKLTGIFGFLSTAFSESKAQKEINPTYMKKRTLGQGSKIKGALCAVLGHEYKVSREITGHIKEYACVHCQKQVTADENGRLSPLTPEKMEINDTLRSVHFKRKVRRASSPEVY